MKMHSLVLPSANQQGEHRLTESDYIDVESLAHVARQFKKANWDNIKQEIGKTLGPF